MSCFVMMSTLLDGLANTSNFSFDIINYFGPKNVENLIP